MTTSTRNRSLHSLEPDSRSLVPVSTGAPMSMLRIYLRRRAARGEPGIRGWFKRKPIARFLVEEALKIGVAYGTVTLGHSGFVHGARHIAEMLPDAPLELLPTCVELVADAAVLDAFVDAFADDLRDAILVRLDGVGYSLGVITD